MAPTSSSKNPSISCSSNQFPGKPNNPVSRNSEISNPLRRSFSGSPFGRPSPVISGQRGGGGTGGFHPNTPVNSPSGYPTRHSIGRDNFVVSSHDFEDKENPKDQSFKAAKSGSPVSVTKGAKNFMSPTISASSKINSSLRKKILVDRNEPSHTSVSFSDAKGLFMEDLDSKADLDAKVEKDTSQKKEVSFDSTVTYLGDQESLTSDEDFDAKEQTGDNNDFDALPEISSIEKDLVNLDPSFKISPGAAYRSPIPALSPPDADPSVQSPYLAPLDADPSMLPYDPKTNYLSPRPQFLHYRPNPRIDYLKKRDAKQLEESFSSETSDTEVVSEEESDSENMQKSSDDSSSDDALKEEEAEGEEKEEKEEEEEEQLPDSELNHVTTTEATADGKRVSNPHFFTKSKLIALLLVLVVGWSWVSVSQSPLMSPFVLNNLNYPQIHVPHDIKELSRNNLDALALEFWTRLNHCYSYITRPFSILREQHKLEVLEHANLCVLSEDCMMNDFVFDHSNSEAEATREEEIDVRPLDLEDSQTKIDELFDHLPEIDEYTEEVPEDNQEHSEEPDEVAVPNNSEAEATREEEIDVRPLELEDRQTKIDELFDHLPEIDEYTDEVPKDNQEHLEEPDEVAVPNNSGVPMELGLPRPVKVYAVARQHCDVAEPGKSEEKNKHEVVTAGNTVVPPGVSDFGLQPLLLLPQPKVLMAGQLEDLSDTCSIDEAEESLSLDVVSDDLQISESLDPSLSGLTATFPPQILAGIGSFVLSLLGITAVFCVKTKKSEISAAAAAPLNQIPLLKKVDKSPSLVPEEHGSDERPASRRTCHTDMDLVGESCPSEMSSFQNNSCHNKKGLMWSGEAQSQERKPRKSYRRESLASSDFSTGSPSYGSFTTYEKITSKRAIAEEKVITPVRRSSRIRNLVASP